MADRYFSIFSYMAYRVLPVIGAMGLGSTGKHGRSNMVHASVGSPACDPESRYADTALVSARLSISRVAAAWPLSSGTRHRRGYSRLARAAYPSDMAWRKPRRSSWRCGCRGRRRRCSSEQLCPWPGPPIRVCSVTRWCVTSGARRGCWGGFWRRAGDDHAPVCARSTGGGFWWRLARCRSLRLCSAPPGQRLADCAHSRWHGRLSTLPGTDCSAQVHR